MPQATATPGLLDPLSLRGFLADSLWGAPLNEPDPKTFYVALPDLGYTDYPTLTTI
jgi:hypothetical protein